MREGEPLSFDPPGDNRRPHAFVAGIGARHFEHFAIGEVNSACQAIRAFRYIRLRLSEDRRRAAVFSLLAMGYDSFHREIAGHFAMRFTTHAIRQNVQIQSRLNLVAILVVPSNAPEVGARPGFYTQRGLMRLVKWSWRLKRVRRSC